MFAFLLALVLSVSPLVGFAPTTVHLRVKSDVGDTVVVIVDDATFYRRTDYPNDGRTHEFDWRDVPEGAHVIHLFIYDHGREVAHTTRSVEFQGR